MDAHEIDATAQEKEKITVTSHADVLCVAGSIATTLNYAITHDGRPLTRGEKLAALHAALAVFERVC